MTKTKAAKETPLMKQYNAIKAKYPGALLLFRVGDFYETFGEDAVSASKILDIVLTKRANGSASEIELAGFPHHALETYLPKLVRAGNRVAICDQLEDPKSVKGIVKRGVTELVTPGLSFNDNVLDKKANNYLASVYFSKENAGVAFLDVSTGEFMAAEKITRLNEIASTTWRRTLSDRIGIAWEEGLRKQRTPEAKLPTQEPLLADKEEHIFYRADDDVIADENPWNFKLDTPQHKYNKGELYNLSVARGTLANEERFKINDHMVQTIIMLNKLPFPKHLRNVPAIAGGHHETMIGTGYPKKLHREDMSLTARMMAIADIFEALTAGDRPYKKAKSLTESLKIMSFMKKDQHIDADLFELFLRSGVYMEYAKQFLAESQIDEVDITDYL